MQVISKSIMIELGGWDDICFQVWPESVVRFLSFIGEQGIDTRKSCSIYEAVDSLYLVEVIRAAFKGSIDEPVSIRV